jgi:hypothetical protein
MKTNHGCFCIKMSHFYSSAKDLYVNLFDENIDII